MIKYVCNLCKKEISPIDLNVIKTQTCETEKVTTVHLHTKCLRDIKIICNTGVKKLLADMAEAERKEAEAAEKKAAKAAEKKAAKSTETVKNVEHSKEDIDAALDAALQSNLDSTEKSETVAKNTHHNSKVAHVNDTLSPLKFEEHLATLDLNFFNGGAPVSRPRNHCLINTQRMLLCMYRGDSLSSIAERLNVGYQTVLQCKNKYSSQSTAERHRTVDRRTRTTIMLINKFIETGSYEQTAAELNLEYDYVKSRITHYTGLGV